VHVRFDEARDDHRILETPVDLDLLVGNPALHFIKRAHTEYLAVHHRHGLGGWRAGIERDNCLGRVDGDPLRGRLRSWRRTLRGRGVDAVRLTCKFVIVCQRQIRHDDKSGDKQQLLYNFHGLSLEFQPRLPGTS
jgi:hypothetical protein